MSRTIFDTPLVNSFFRALSQIGLKLSGWTLSGETPKDKKYVLIAAPHTSNWDFILLIAIAFTFRIKVSWMGKNNLFKGPAGPVMRWMGGIPVERSKNTGLVQQVVDRFNEADELVVTIPPEGTRSKVRQWKSGFYHVANGAGVPVVLGFLDFKKKVGGFGPTFMPTGNYEEDLKEIQGFYQNISGKLPDQF